MAFSLFPVHGDMFSRLLIQNIVKKTGQKSLYHIHVLYNGLSNFHPEGKTRHSLE